jgi:hypothetical protein
MRNLILITLALLASNSIIFAQDFVQVNYGPSYSQGVFYTLSNDETQEVFNEDWHIMLSAIDLQDAGIHFNEATSLSGENLEAYIAPTPNFEDDIDVNDLVLQVYNPDVNWRDGAFNTLRDSTNALDYGWGSYSPGSRKVEGREVFVLKLRNGDYLKFMIEELNGTVYTIKWADLDGSNEKTLQVDKAQFAQGNLVMVDLLDSEVIGAQPGFDLFFTRYITPLDDGTGAFLDYNVTGVLSAPGVTVAQADGIDPETVAFEDYTSDFSDDIQIIGQDWKEFNLQQFMWVLPEDRAYFIKDRNNVVWKVIFIDFEGSSTGGVVFTKEEVGMLTSIQDIKAVSSWLVHPNPVDNILNVVMEVEESLSGNMMIIDQKGAMVRSWDIETGTGLITIERDLGQLPQGAYQLVLSINGGQMSTGLIKN